MKNNNKYRSPVENILDEMYNEAFNELHQIHAHRNKIANKRVKRLVWVYVAIILAIVGMILYTRL